MSVYRAVDRVGNSRLEYIHLLSLNPFVPTAPYKGALNLSEIAKKTQELMGYDLLIKCNFYILFNTISSGHSI